MKSGSIAVGVALAMAMVTSSVAAQAADGQAVYREECKSCHGINGVPPARERAKYKKIRTVGDSGFVTRLSEDSIVTILRKGIDTNMKSFAAKLSEAEMVAVARYIRTLGKKDGS